MIDTKSRKINWKNYFKTKLYIASFILALVGWFILFVYLFGQYFEKELLALEGTINSPFFTWGLRIVIIASIILLIKGKKRIQKFFINKSIRWGIYIIYIIGALGWLAWFLSLFL
ncbi:hypothetical protein [Methanobacterium ferruginis]|jgi:hypothetical protein|uniref:hypothetical protein n=1 Tax=Methanobacterium ferruginis TaxID=710191 RepID=UPI0025725CB8|nr:hypothetical protein [Methanobacterium ferruginis]MCC7550947.1 hypothetical protein [Methanobacterium sp.]BDZ67870.1 hypothetical protein GCM10025860_13180 [Methanobacterium ferruginis]